MKKLILVTMVTAYAVSLFGQSSSLAGPTLPDITFKSPKAASMQKFGEYPVSLFTGLVDTTIPIYEIDINGIKVPIEFKYHASGIKYDDRSLELGLGWSLMAGGNFSHQFRGDLLYTTGSTPSVVKRMEEIDPRGLGSTSLDCGNIYLECVARGAGAFESISPQSYSPYPIDGEMDMIQYALPTQQGSIAYRLGQTINIPNKPILFDLYSNRITDENGVSYEFDEQERSTFGKNTARHLTEIISADKIDTVYFSYERPDIILSQPTFSSMELGVKSVIDFQGYLNVFIRESRLSAAPSGHTSTPPILKKISYRGGEIRFNYDPTYKRSLTEIQIYTGKAQNMRLQSKVKVSQSNFSGIPYALRRLDKVTFCDNNSKELYDYQFGYEGSPRYYGSSGFDYWGYYNDRGATNNRVPRFENLYSVSFQPGSTSQWSNDDDVRNPDPASSRQGMLNKIVYPTKGYTKFEYEAHKSAGAVLGGQRIRSIEHYNSDHTLIDKRTYKYGENEDGNGCCLAYLAYNGKLNIDKSDFCSTQKIVTHTYEPDLLFPVAIDGYDYEIVDVFNVFPRRNYTINGSPAVYTSVSEYYGSETTNIGKVVYSYNYYDSHYPHWTYRGLNPDYPLRSYEWKNGLPTQKAIYDKNNNLVYCETHTYRDLRLEEELNIRVIPEVTIQDPCDKVESISHPSAEDIGLNFNNYANIYFSEAFEIIGNSRFDFFNYYTNTGLPVIDHTTIFRDGVSTTVHYKYNDLGQRIRSAEYTSQGDSLVTTYKHPYDLTDGVSYCGSNVLSPILEQAVYKNNVLQDMRKTDYAKVGTGYYPSSVRYLNREQNALELRIVYHSYDVYGNPTYITKDNTTKVVYLWGYRGLYPIAEFKGVDYTTVSQYLGVAFISRVLEAVEPSASDMATIDNLRKALPFAQTHISTYTYKPGVGLTSETDPAGCKMNYEYDASGKLARVLDHNGNVVNSYRYNYKIN